MSDSHVVENVVIIILLIIIVACILGLLWVYTRRDAITDSSPLEFVNVDTVSDLTTVRQTYE